MFFQKSVPPLESPFRRCIFELIDQMCDAMRCFDPETGDLELGKQLGKIKSVLTGRTDVENASLLLKAFVKLISDYQQKQASLLIHMVVFFNDKLQGMNPIGVAISTLYRNKINKELNSIYDEFLELVKEFKVLSQEELKKNKNLSDAERDKQLKLAKNHTRFIMRASKFALAKPCREIPEGPSAVIPIGTKFETRSRDSADSSDSDDVQNPTILQLRNEGYVLSKFGEINESESNRGPLLMDFKRRHFRICGKDISKWAEEYNSCYNKQITDDFHNIEKNQITILRYAIEQMYLGYGKNNIEKIWSCDTKTKKEWDDFNKKTHF
jgi:hypothetical protein